VLRDFYELGRTEYAHAGMVRNIFEEQCQIKWRDLEKMVG
jgi:hypothetical protein